MKYVGYYMGTVMHNDTVANVRIYVVDKEVETLLSGPACEALGIISFHGENAVPHQMLITSPETNLFSIF